MSGSDLFGTGLATVVMGGQYGSCGKGEFIAWAANRYRPGAVIRTGGPNAGHTMTLGAKEYKMRQIPCGWNIPTCDLAIAPGSLVNLDVLLHELKMLREAGEDVGNRLYIDGAATVLTHQHKEMEEGSDLKERLGSTREGIGAARSERLWRRADLMKYVFGDWRVVDTTDYHLEWLDLGGIIIESTQGFGLSLHLSGNYPFVTSADITPGHLLGEAGISSRQPHRVVAVMRTMPIRVAGNSGWIAGEAGWQDLHDSNNLIPSDGEKTTVTRLTRRIGEWDPVLAERMGKICKPDAICLTFLDYVDPTCRHATEWGDLSATAKDFISKVEDDTFTPVEWVSVGPGRIIERPDGEDV